MCPYKFELRLWTDDERIGEEILTNKKTNEELQIRMKPAHRNALEIKRGALTSNSKISSSKCSFNTYTLKSSKIRLLFNRLLFLSVFMSDFEVKVISFG